MCSRYFGLYMLVLDETVTANDMHVLKDALSRLVGLRLVNVSMCHSLENIPCIN